MKKNEENKPAFPGKSNAMGYEVGLSKLEYMSLYILTSNSKTSYAGDTKGAIDLAKRLLKELAKQTEET